jgi:pimeloyl-ACP methyl ester carboxylesterase
MFRAARTGVQLAEAISRTTGQKFTLVGHSLGARVIYYALEALSTKDTLFVDNVILLGGAIGRKDKEGWERAANAVSGKIYNCFSEQDKILDVFYRTANAGLSDPIGVRPIDCGGEKIVNIDCSSFVESHMTWKEHYAHIHRLIFGSKD